MSQPHEVYDEFIITAPNNTHVVIAYRGKQRSLLVAAQTMRSLGIQSINSGVLGCNVTTKSVLP